MTPSAITAREREVIALLVTGHSNREIAGVLVLSEQSHELALASIPEGVTVDEVIQSFATTEGQGLPGVEFIAGTGAEPGQKSNLVFTEPLAAGRYLMICFRPDTAEAPEGTPHALKGMVKDFTVE